MSDIRKLIARREKLLRKIHEAPLWLNGSVVETTRKVRGKEAPFHYLSQSIKGKNKITYISATNLKRFKAAIAQGAKMKMLQYELGIINIKLIKAGYGND